MSLKLSGNERVSLSGWLDNELAALVDYDPTIVTEFLLMYLKATPGLLDGANGVSCLESELNQFLGQATPQFVRKLIPCLLEKHYLPKRSRSRSASPPRRSRSRSRSRRRTSAEGSWRDVQSGRRPAGSPPIYNDWKQNPSQQPPQQQPRWSGDAPASHLPRPVAGVSAAGTGPFLESLLPSPSSQTLSSMPPSGQPIRPHQQGRADHTLRTVVIRGWEPGAHPTFGSIENHFSGFGRIPRIGFSKDNREAYLMYANHADAASAIASRSSIPPLGGTKLSVSWAKHDPPLPADVSAQAAEESKVFPDAGATGQHHAARSSGGGHPKWLSGGSNETSSHSSVNQPPPTAPSTIPSFPAVPKTLTAAESAKKVLEEKKAIASEIDVKIASQKALLVEINAAKAAKKVSELKILVAKFKALTEEVKSMQQAVSAAVNTAKRAVDSAHSKVFGGSGGEVALAGSPSSGDKASLERGPGEKEVKEGSSNAFSGLSSGVDRGVADEEEVEIEGGDDS